MVISCVLLYDSLTSLEVYTVGLRWIILTLDRWSMTSANTISHTEYPRGQWVKITATSPRGQWANCGLHSEATTIRNAHSLQYIPRNMHTFFALLCFVVVIHWLIFPYPSGLLHWHCGNLTIAPVPAKQPWWIWINTSCEFILNDSITTTKQSTKKMCAYFLGYTVSPMPGPWTLQDITGHHRQGVDWPGHFKQPWLLVKIT